MTTTEVIRITAVCIGYAFLVFSMIPLIRSNYWFIRIFDYPRSQKFWVNAMVLATFAFTAKYDLGHDRWLLLALFLNQIYLLTQIWPYTRLTKVQMKRNEAAGSDNVRLFIANVFQDNHDTASLKSSIRKNDPDVVLLVEVDEQWLADLKELEHEYPHRIYKPQSNTYGIVLFSKLKIVKHAIRFLIEHDVPSFIADIESRQGKSFRLFGLHPKPPVPGESGESTDRDAEILIIGKEAKKCNLPVIVAGDLNDVAWSYTTRLFLKISGLLDPRIGRGFFSTFHASYRFLRWPLDHVFFSSHFLLNSIERLPHIGSDHFPILIDVALQPQEVKENRKEEKSAKPKDKKLAEEKIKEAK